MDKKENFATSITLLKSDTCTVDFIPYGRLATGLKDILLPVKVLLVNISMALKWKYIYFMKARSIMSISCNNL